LREMTKNQFRISAFTCNLAEITDHKSRTAISS